MKHDQFGQTYYNENDLVNFVYENPDLDLSLFLVDFPEEYNKAIKDLYADLPLLNKYNVPDSSTDNLNKFDQKNQSHWFMPESYKEMDIAAWVLSQCKNEEELQRVGQELLMFQERNLFDLLRFLKYLVDTLRSNNLVWGVGRGSSVASYVLYLIGVHRINSLFYDLPIDEFLK